MSEVQKILYKRPTFPPEVLPCPRGESKKTTQQGGHQLPRRWCLWASNLRILTPEYFIQQSNKILSSPASNSQSTLMERMKEEQKVDSHYPLAARSKTWKMGWTLDVGR